MALIECPDCKREVSDAAKACPHCGCPIADERRSFYTSAPARSAQLTPTVATAAVQPLRPETAGSWKCPQCGSVGAFRGFPELYENGAPSESTLTDVPERVEPPMVIRPGRASAAAVAVGAVLGLLLALAVFGYVHSVVVAGLAGLAIVGAAIAISRRPRTVAASGAEMDAWRRRYMCTSCGYVREIPG